MSTSTEHPPPDEATMLAVLDDAVEALHEAGIAFLMIGGIASTVYGRDRGTGDIDIFVRPEQVPNVIGALEGAGFETSVEYEHWLHKARRDGVTVDVILRASRDILLDEEMLARATVGIFRGRTLPIAPPEDLLVMKAIAAGEDTARYWYDALSLLGRPDLDWTYLVHRAKKHGARRVLSLLFFAQSIDLLVPEEVVAELLEAIRQVGTGAGD
jgi:predicted nucleotidyltransferase